MGLSTDFMTITNQSRLVQWWTAASSATGVAGRSVRPPTSSPGGLPFPSSRDVSSRNVPPLGRAQVGFAAARHS
ncbi:hypothetical protein VPH35_025425 [Triticum aestivum]